VAKEQAPIIVKKIKKVAGGHHGGAWKIAYADFVTAMMAFFLLMWLLGASSKAKLAGIADYFKTPLKVAMLGGDGAGDASSVIKGGGTDLTASAGQVKNGENKERRRATSFYFSNVDPRDASEGVEKGMDGEGMKLADPTEELLWQTEDPQEAVYPVDVATQIDDAKNMKELKESIEALMEAQPNLAEFKDQMLIEVTRDGLKIQIIDEKNRPMFDTASARLKDYTVEILHQLAPVLNDVPYKISIYGHTDGAPYSAGEKSYSNWELSSDRANASRRELVTGGLQENKMVQVVGLGSTVPFNPDDPLDPANRRISMVVMNHLAEFKLLRDGSTLNVGNKNIPEKGLISIPEAPKGDPIPLPPKEMPKPEASATPPREHDVQNEPKAEHSPSSDPDHEAHP
jgi:chemotaxis protein MotB